MPAKPIDEVELQERADHILSDVYPGCVVEKITPLQGGNSSITFWTTFTTSDGDEQKVVLKVAPAGLEPTRNRDVLRQARLQRALEETAFRSSRGGPAPGRAPEVPPFFIMSFEEATGRTQSAGAGNHPSRAGSGSELQRRRILGSLHTTDPMMVGLGKKLRGDTSRRGSTLGRTTSRRATRISGRAPKASREAPRDGSRGRTTLIQATFDYGNTLSQYRSGGV